MLKICTLPGNQNPEICQFYSRHLDTIAGLKLAQRNPDVPRLSASQLACESTCRLKAGADSQWLLSLSGRRSPDAPSKSPLGEDYQTLTGVDTPFIFLQVSTNVCFSVYTALNLLLCNIIIIIIIVIIIERENQSEGVA